jgi:SAM-dependent methyltransferase
VRKISVDQFEEWEGGVGRNDLFLDVGCWSGATVLRMNDKCEAYGVDFNKETLKLADKRIADRLKYSDITKNIAFNKKFDWVFCSEVVEHIEKDREALGNISKIMKKGGHLVLTTPRSVRFFEFWDPAWVRWKFGGKERHWHYTLKELDSKMSRVGLKIKRYAVQGNFKWVVRRWINVILQYLIRTDFKVKNSKGDGFSDWMILAEKI